MKLMMEKGVIFTHNHPRGSSFSQADVSMFNRLGLKEIRAVSENGLTHSLKLGNRTEYILANGISNEKINDLFTTAKTWATLKTDQIWENRPNNVSDEWVKKLNYMLYHETMLYFTNMPELKGYYIYNKFKD